MEVWTVWGTSKYGMEIHLDDRKFRSMYNWLFDSSYGTITRYGSLSKEDSKITLTVL